MTTVSETEVTSLTDVREAGRGGTIASKVVPAEYNWGRGKRVASIGASSTSWSWISGWRRRRAVAEAARCPPAATSSLSPVAADAAASSNSGWFSWLSEPEYFVPEKPRRRRLSDSAIHSSTSTSNDNCCDTASATDAVDYKPAAAAVAVARRDKNDVCDPPRYRMPDGSITM